MSFLDPESKSLTRCYFCPSLEAAEIYYSASAVQRHLASAGEMPSIDTAANSSHYADEGRALSYNGETGTFDEGPLRFEDHVISFSEDEPPHQRMPLTDKIEELAGSAN